MFRINKQAWITIHRSILLAPASSPINSSLGLAESHFANISSSYFLTISNIPFSINLLQSKHCKQTRQGFTQVPPFYSTLQKKPPSLGPSFINCSTTFWSLMHWSFLWVLSKLRTPMVIRPNFNLLSCVGFGINRIRALGTLKMRKSASPSSSSPRVLRMLMLHRCSSKFY